MLYLKALPYITYITGREYFSLACTNRKKIEVSKVEVDVQKEDFHFGRKKPTINVSMSFDSLSCLL